MKKAILPFLILLIIIFSLFLLNIFKSESSKREVREKENKTIAREEKTEPRFVEENEEKTTQPQSPFPIPAQEADAPPNPLPTEWEEPLFVILNNSHSREERNSRLYLFAVTTALYAPRVQEECLAHLSFGINNSEKEFALQIMKDLRIVETARVLMFENMSRVRPKELMSFLATGIVQTLPNSVLGQNADQYLLDLEQKEGAPSAKEEYPKKDKNEILTY